MTINTMNLLDPPCTSSRHQHHYVVLTNHAARCCHPVQQLPPRPILISRHRQTYVVRQYVLTTASNHYQRSNDQIAATPDKTTNVTNVLPIMLVAACQPPSTAERLSPTASRTLHEELPPLIRAGVPAYELPASRYKQCRPTDVPR